MKNRVLLSLILALFVLAAVSAWGQVSTGLSNQSRDSKTGAGGEDPLGHRGHINRGCMMCHVPHSTSAMLTSATPTQYNNTQASYKQDSWSGGTKTTTTTTNNWYTMDGIISPGQQWAEGAQDANGNVDPTKRLVAPDATLLAAAQASGINFSTAGMGIAGNVYLWVRPITPITFTTYDTHTISGTAGTLTPQMPVVHSLLCLSCHDTSVNSHDWANYPHPTAATYSTNPGTEATLIVNGSPMVPNDWGGTFTNALGKEEYHAGEVGGVGRTLWTNGAGSNGWGAGSLLNSHPVDVKYPTDFTKYWRVTFSGNNVLFTDDSFTLDTGVSGHPARLYKSGTDAYMECTSCHNPHRLTSYAFPDSTGAWKVGGANTTAYYIRGPFSAMEPGGESTGRNDYANAGTVNSNFCRSCHYDKSQNWMASAGAASN